jgi:hypothetical protein
LLDQGNEDQKLILAEIYRELENFNSCIGLLKDGREEEDDFNAKILERAEGPDPRLFRLR